MIVYSVVISAHEKGKYPRLALHSFRKMQLQGLLPNVITYNAAISGCEKGQSVQMATHLLQEMLLQDLLPRPRDPEYGHFQ